VRVAKILPTVFEGFLFEPSDQPTVFSYPNEFSF
jgi:hypothetical protein